MGLRAPDELGHLGAPGELGLRGCNRFVSAVWLFYGCASLATMSVGLCQRDCSRYGIAWLQPLLDTLVYGSSRQATWTGTSVQAACLDRLCPSM